MRVTNNITHNYTNTSQLESIQNGIDQIINVLNNNSNDNNSNDNNSSDNNSSENNNGENNSIETTEIPFIKDDKLKTFSLSFQTGALLQHSSDGKEFTFSLEDITKPTLNSNLVPSNIVTKGFSASDFKEILSNVEIQEQIKELDISLMVHSPEMETFQFVKTCEDISVTGDIGNRMLHVKFTNGFVVYGGIEVDTMFLQQIMTYAGPDAPGAHLHIDIEWQDNAPGHFNKVNKMIRALPEKFFTPLEDFYVENITYTFVDVVRDIMSRIDGDIYKIDGKYYYTSTDFKAQDYIQNENIITGEFSVPIKDSLDNHIGWISWQSLSYPPEVNEKWSVQETMTISFGKYETAVTYNGSALSIASGGYYDMNVPYKFCVYGPDDKAYVTITKISDTIREIHVSHTNDFITTNEDNYLTTFSFSYQTGALLGRNSTGSELRFLLKDITKPTQNSNLARKDEVMKGLSANDFQMLLSNETLWSKETINIDPNRPIRTSLMVHTPQMETFQIITELSEIVVSGEDPETRELHVKFNQGIVPDFVEKMMTFAGTDVTGAHVHVDFEWQDNTPLPYNSVYQVINALPQEYLSDPQSFVGWLNQTFYLQSQPKRQYRSIAPTYPHEVHTVHAYWRRISVASVVPGI